MISVSTLLKCVCCRNFIICVRDEMILTFRNFNKIATTEIETGHLASYVLLMSNWISN